MVCGCSVTDKFKADSNTNPNVSAPTPALTTSSTPSVSPTAPSDNDKASLGSNLLAFGAGTNIVAVASESQDSPNQAVKLIDEFAYGEGWRTAGGQAANQSVTLEFPVSAIANFCPTLTATAKMP